MFFLVFFCRLAVNEKADCVAKCTEQVCASLVEDTLHADIVLLVEDVVEAELQRIHKYINRCENKSLIPNLHHFVLPTRPTKNKSFRLNSLASMCFFFYLYH